MLRIPLAIVTALMTCILSYGNTWDTNKKVKQVELDASSDSLRVWIDNSPNTNYYYSYPTTGIYLDYSKSYLALFMTAISTGLAVDFYVPSPGTTGGKLSSAKIHQ